MLRLTAFEHVAHRQNIGLQGDILEFHQFYQALVARLSPLINLTEVSNDEGKTA